MESTIGKRIRQLREAKGLTVADFAKCAGVKPSAIYGLESDANKPSIETVAMLRQSFPDLNSEWLQFGDGPMLRDGRVLTPVVTEEATPAKTGFTSGVATVEYVDSILLREQMKERITGLEIDKSGLKDELTEAKAEIRRLREALGKSPDSPDAADALSPLPRNPLGFGAAIQATLLASYAAEPVEAE